MTDTEKTVVSEFPPVNEGKPVHAAPVRSTPPHGAEPLREPSNRPAPAPFQQTRAARSGTLLMPGVSADEFAAHAPKPPAAAARPNPPPSATPARPQNSAAPHGDNAPRTAAAPRTANAPTPDAAPASKATAGTPVHRTEPLHLSLDARDMVPKASRSVRPGLPRTRAPRIILVAGISVLLLIAVLAWSRHAAPVAAAPAEVPVDGLRSSAVPAAPAAAPATSAAIPSTPSAVPTAQPATAAATQKPAAAPAAAAPAERAQPTAKPSDAPAAEAKPAAKPAQHQSAAKARAPATKVPSENSESIENAREALKALESPPVVRVKRKADDEDRAPSGDEGVPPAPPPLPDPEGE